MTLTQLAKLYDLKLSITYQACPGVWLASFDEVHDSLYDGTEEVQVGKGNTPGEALTNYADKIKGHSFFHIQENRIIEFPKKITQEEQE